MFCQFTEAAVKTSTMNLPIIAQSKNYIVINKPAGVSVHNDPADVIHLLKKQLPSGSYQDIYPVHRLDKETSGLLVVALNEKSAASLAAQFQSGETTKIYSAVLRGAITDLTLHWKWAISDKAEGRKNPQGMSKDRVNAETLVTVEKTNKFFSLVRVKILTGRQHQIRKHAAMARHAILGDDRYSDPKYNSKMAELYKTDRMFLHAQKLTIKIDNESHTFEAPLPSEFLSILD